jgi:flagellar biogenesis protein FliO
MKHIFSLLLVLFVVGSSMPQMAVAKKAKVQSVASTKADSKLDSSSEIWIDSSKDKAEYAYQGDNSDEATEETSKPFSIIFFLVLSLIVVVGIMLLSIFNLGGKKKQALATSSQKERVSSLRLLDTLPLDGGKVLYLVELFNRKFLIASNWYSINLVSEVEGNFTEQPIEETASSLDFMTLAPEESNQVEEDNSENPIAALGNLYNEVPEPNYINQSEIQTSRTTKSNILSSFSRHFISSKGAKPNNQELTTPPKLIDVSPSIAPEDENELANASKQAQSASPETIVKRSNTPIADTPVETQIQRSTKPTTSPIRAKEVPGITKKPSWLQERETQRQQEAARYLNNWRNKGVAEKQVLPDLKPQAPVLETKPTNNSQLKDKINSAAKLAANLNNQKNYLEELEHSIGTKLEALSESNLNKVAKTSVSRKISIVE